MKRATLWIALLAIFPLPGQASTDPLEDLSLEDLVKAEITSVSRKSQSLADVPAAAFIITAEDIRRSGAQALPDVLRMAPGIEVAQIDNGRYAVSARGFNGRFANKLQVLIDGRSIYHPLFAGVLWELDPIPLDDIERIEIIRGAGAVMWGANAVNGVINIISKHSRNQTGGAVHVTGGSKGTGDLYARIGQAVSDETSWKLSVQGRHIEPSRQFESTEKALDRLNNAVVDFRLDHEIGGGRDLSIWANASRSRTTELWNTNPTFSPLGGLTLSAITPLQELHSESIVGRYRWLSDSGIESSIQSSFTRSGIEITDFLMETRDTVDIDYQGRYAISHHDLLWGLNYRSSSDSIDTNAPYISINPTAYTQKNTGVFIHDDWTLTPEKLKLGIGLRADETSSNGTNFSTNASLLWTPSRTDSAWIKYAQAPRTSARAERDVSILAGVSVSPYMVGASSFNLPIIVHANANSSLGAEQAKGFEAGYRKQFSSAFSADLSAYRYRYTKMRTGDVISMYGCSPLFGALLDNSKCSYFGLQPTVSNPLGTPVMFVETQTINGLAGWSNGLELSADWLVTPNWRLQLSYSLSRLKMDGSANTNINADAEITERSSPRHYGSLRSQWNVTTSQQFDLWLRSSGGFDRQKLIDTTPNATGAVTYTHVPGYLTLDLRYAYRVNKDLEFALIGRNLINTHRLENISDYIPSAASVVSPTWLLSTRWSF